MILFASGCIGPVLNLGGLDYAADIMFGGAGMLVLL